MESFAACAQGSVNLDGVLCGITEMKSSGFDGSPSLAFSDEPELLERGDEEER